MKIVITGASGFIGRRLSQYLTERDHEVIALIRSEKNKKFFEDNGIIVKHGDVTNPESLKKAFENADAVLHLAALFNHPGASWEQYTDVNVIGTKNVLETAKASNIKRVVHCSTVGVAIAGTMPYSENSPYLLPKWDKYETTKGEAEKLALKFYQEEQFPVVVIRPAQVYGPGDESKAKFYRMVKKGIIVNPGKTLKHLIYIDDLCKAFELALQEKRAVGETFIIAGKEVTPLKKMIQLSAHKLGVPTPKLILPSSLMTALCTVTENICNTIKIKPILFRRSMDFFTKSVSFDVSKAKNLLNFVSEMEVEQGIDNTISWYQENDLL